MASAKCMCSHLELKCALNVVFPVTCDQIFNPRATCKLTCKCHLCELRPNYFVLTQFEFTDVSDDTVCVCECVSVSLQERERGRERHKLVNAQL